jgi:hypothetical protein
LNLPAYLPINHFSVQMCLSQSCTNTTYLTKDSDSYFLSGQLIWASTGRMLVSVSMSFVTSKGFTAEVSPSCPKIGYFLKGTTSPCQKCRSCDHNSYSPDETCPAGSLEDFTGYCQCQSGYFGDGDFCWTCSQQCSYSGTCTLTPSGPKCICNRGYYESGDRCLPCKTCPSESTTPGATYAVGTGSTADIQVCKCKAGTYPSLTAVGNIVVHAIIPAALTHSRLVPPV